MAELQRMSIKVSKEMHEWLQNEADKRGLTMNALIIFALENYQRETVVIPNIPKMMELVDEIERSKDHK